MNALTKNDVLSAIAGIIGDTTALTDHQRADVIYTALICSGAMASLTEVSPETYDAFTKQMVDGFLAVASQEFSSAEHKEVQELIDANELGIALEHSLCIFMDGNRMVSDDLFDVARTLAMRMQLVDEPVFQMFIGWMHKG